MSNTGQIETNLDEAERFLLWAYPAGPWVLTAIPVEGGRTTTETFFDIKAALGWVAQFAGKQNLYWTVNKVRCAMDKKPKKEDIEEALFLHVDLDPAKGEDATKARERILKTVEDFSPSPSAVIDSGGGIQCFWKLDEPLYIGGTAERWTDLEAYNRQLGIVLGGDNTWNVDRIMRLPGTVNLPDEKKRKKGRIERTAAAVELSDATYPLSDFTAAPEVQASNSGSGVRVQISGNLPRLKDLDELPEAVSQRTRMLIVQGDDPDDPTRYSSKSEVMWAVTCELIRAGCKDDIIASVLLDPDFGVSDHPLRQKRSVEYVARQIERAREEVGTIRPKIVWSDVEMSRCLDEAESSLIRSGLPVYQMGDRLVQVVTLLRASGDDDAVRRAAGSLVIAPLPKRRLLEHFLSTARFVKISQLKDGSIKEAPFAPPLHFAETYMARRGAWRLPVLTGIATTPTMRTDGSVVSADGYDTASGLIINTQGAAFAPVPDSPSRGEGRAALNTLVDVIGEFPFVSDDEGGRPGGNQPSQSRSAALAMILTAVARPMFSAAPMFGISAPTMATGKSLLADVPAMIVTGRRATKMSQGASEEEDEKRLLSTLMQGDLVNVIDNIARPIEGDALCTILTEETWRCRVLGRSEMRDVGTKATFIATGNNLSFRNDMASRAVLASLDAELENPGERVFRRDLKKHVPEHRAELAVAALTVLRSYIAADRPSVEGMAASRFDDWAVVRAALIWLGEPDPWATNERVAVGDEARAGHRELMTAIAEAFGYGQFLATTEIIARTDLADRSNDDRLGADLRLALAAALPHGVSANGLDRFMSGLAGRRVEGIWIKVTLNEKKGNRYAILSSNAPEAERLSAQGQLLGAQAGVAAGNAQNGGDAPY